MTIEKSSNGQKLSKTQKKHKRDEATRIAKQMLGSPKAANEQIEKFVELIDELDASKYPGAKVGPGGKVISSIFDLDLLREKKYLLQDWVKRHKEQKTVRPKDKLIVPA